MKILDLCVVLGFTKIMDNWHLIPFCLVVIILWIHSQRKHKIKQIKKTSQIYKLGEFVTEAIRLLGSRLNLSVPQFLIVNSWSLVTLSLQLLPMLTVHTFYFLNSRNQIKNIKSGENS